MGNVAAKAAQHSKKFNIGQTNDQIYDDKKKACAVSQATINKMWETWQSYRRNNRLQLSSNQFICTFGWVSNWSQTQLILTMIDEWNLNISVVQNLKKLEETGI